MLAKKDSDTAVFLMDNVMMFAMLMAAAMSFGLAAVGPTFAPWFYGAEFSRCGLFIVMLSPIIIFKGWAGALRTQYIIPAKKRSHLYYISNFRCNYKFDYKFYFNSENRRNRCSNRDYCC